MKVDRKELATLCREMGPQLQCPDGVDGVRLLWAIAGRETTFGDNCTTMHEAGYCYGGKYSKDAVVKHLSTEWGCLAHQSYGPWQILFYEANRFDPAADPIHLLNSPIYCGALVVKKMNDIFAKQHPATVREIADAWNSGSCRDAIIPKDYMDAVQSNYDNVPLP
jgi:hypothetical protein